MTLNESDLKALRSRETRAATRDGCLSADLLAAAAQGDLASADRARVADHLAGCADCAEELRLIQPLQAWSERTAEAYGREPQAAPAASSWQWAWQLASLILVIAVGGLLTWNVALRQDNADLMARATTAVAMPPPAPAPAPTTFGGEVNVPIVDLQTDAFRGSTGSAVPSVTVTAALATLILATDLRDASGAYRLSILDISDRVVWQSDALAMTAFNTFTVAVSPRDLGAGLFRLVLSRPGEARPLHVYQLRIAQEGATR